MKNILKATMFIFIFCSSLLFGCAPKIIDNHNLLANARDKSIQNQKYQFWQNELTALDYTVLAKDAQNKLSNFAFHAHYRIYQEQQIRFVLLMPQGSELGRCSGKINEECCTASLFPNAETLVKNSLGAVQTLISIKPDLDANYYLQYEDKTLTDICANKLLLVYEKKENSQTTRLLYDIDGILLGGYCKEANRLIWTITFIPTQTSEQYTKFLYQQSSSPLRLEIKIMEVF